MILPNSIIERGCLRKNNLLFEDAQLHSSAKGISKLQISVYNLYGRGKKHKRKLKVKL